MEHDELERIVDKMVALAPEGLETVCVLLVARDGTESGHCVAKTFDKGGRKEMARKLRSLAARVGAP